MKTGAGISGGAHIALIAAAVFIGEFASEAEAIPVPIAEVTLMTGTEFEAATSAAPEFNAETPAAPEAPNQSEERADVEVSETDAAPSTEADPNSPDLPAQGEDVRPLQDQTVSADIAEVGDQPAAPPAPENSVIVAATEETDVIAPVAETQVVRAPEPAARPSAPSLDTSSPTPPEPQPVIEPEPEPQPEPEPEVVEPQPEPEPTPEPQVAETPAQPEPQPEPVPEEQEVVKLNDPTIPAPKLAPPPPTRPKELAEAAEARRKERERQRPADTGATQQAESNTSSGTTRTAGKLSFRDRESLRVGIKGFFNPPTGLQNEDQIAVKVRIELSQDGRITAGPSRRAPSRPDAAHRAVEMAGIRALKKAEAAGVFRRLPKDKYAQWRVIDVTFTPREIVFL